MPEMLSGYALTVQHSLGRCYPEKPHLYRSDFERDRDRIIHCSAFRRLEGKTQVVAADIASDYADHYRTRMTHTIEVAQIGRTIARALGLNESLTEAVCLAHDIGHSPFGHSGEEVLDSLMKDFGGFEHNRQALRIVELLEHPYPNFRGLNLMYETRLGLLKSDLGKVVPAVPAGSAGRREPELNCSLEGQVADVADRIAYNCHDLEDGMRAGVIKEPDLRNVEIFGLATEKIGAYSIVDDGVRKTRVAKEIIDSLVSHCIKQTGINIQRIGINSVCDVYRCRENIVAFSPESVERLVELEMFLLKRFYLKTSLKRAADKVRHWLTMLFDEFCRRPDLLPPYFRQLADRDGLARTVCDYISGMTDRYCLATLEKICPGSVVIGE